MFLVILRRILIAGLLLTLLPVPVRARPGDLDHTFNATGYTRYDGKLSSVDSSAAVVPAPDGSLFVAGSTWTSAVWCEGDTCNQLLLVLKYDAGGNLDPSFGDGGVVSYRDDLFTYAVARGLALNPDGTLLVAGEVGTATTSNAVVLRLTAAGQLDTTFGGGDGIAFLPDTRITTLLRQSDGKMILPGPVKEKALVRLNVDGTLDTAFGNGGTAPNPFTGDAPLRAAALAPDDKILMAGLAITGPMVLIRFLSNGLPDPAFGTGGIAIGPLSLNSLVVDGLAVLANGRIAVTGLGRVPELPGMVTALFSASGNPAPAFGGEDGVSFTVPGLDDRYLLPLAGRFPVLLPDGSLVVAGEIANQATGSDVLLLKLTPAGEPDAAFGGGKGFVYYSHHAATSDRFNSTLALPDGSIVAAGYAGDNDATHLLLRRYLPDGSVDTAFGDGGTVLHGKQGAGEDVATILRQADGKILALGYTWLPDLKRNQPLVVRFLADGTPDPTFGSDGSVTIPSAQGIDGWIIGGVLQNDGLVVAAVGGYVDGGYVFRLLADGGLDPAFGTDGFVQFADDASFSGVALQPDGKLVLAGVRATGSNPDLTVWRLLADGTRDPSFGAGKGWVRISLTSTEDAWSYGGGVAVQANGRIVAVGEAILSANNSSAVAVRLLPNGELDPSFGKDGVVDFHHDRDGDFNDIQVVMLQPDGKIVLLGGTMTYGLGASSWVIRLHPDGTLDPSFRGDGWAHYVKTPIRSVYLFLGGALRPDGGLLIAGGGGNHDGWLVKLKGDDLHLLTPNGREVLRSGSKVSVSWSTLSPLAGIEQVRLSWSPGPGKLWRSVIALDGNPGSFEWKVPRVCAVSRGAG